MKMAILVGDGMGDLPVDALGGRTLLQVARIPHIRRIAAAGRVRLVRTVPDGMEPGSDIANLSLLGYNPGEQYTGRAPIEAAGAGVAMGPEDVAYRCNLVTLNAGRMLDYSAGEISSEEGRALLETLDREIGRPGITFYPGVSYRHLMIWQNGPIDLRTQPPHDIAEKQVAPYLPTGHRQDEVRALMDASRAVFARHPVNQARESRGALPATQIWLWGQGRAMALTTYQELYGLRGGVVSAVDLVRGLGRLAGLQADKIPGATGFIDTNYANKVSAACAILDASDFVFLHVEAPDECGHKGLLDLKRRAIEDFDAQVVAPMWAYLERGGEPYRLMICTDHRTPVASRNHTNDPVPMAWVDGPVGVVNDEAPFDEYVEGGQTSAMAHDIIRERLRR